MVIILNDHVLLPKIHIADLFLQELQIISDDNKIHDKHTLGSLVGLLVVSWVTPLTQSVGSSVGAPKTD